MNRKRVEWQKFPEGIKSVVGLGAFVVIAVILILMEVSAR